MPAPEASPLEAAESAAAFVEVRYSLPELLRDVNRDRASVSFAMEKLDQAAINTLFEQQRSPHGPKQQP
jgi:hypothetical protein